MWNPGNHSGPSELQNNIVQEYVIPTPLYTPVAPISREIEYSGDPGGAFIPEEQKSPTGPQTLIVLLVYFSDLTNTESSSTISSIIFTNVSDYYDEVSYGQSSITGAVAGWYNLGNSKAYYGADGATSGATDDTNDDGSNDSWKLVDDALAVADPYVDFSSYGHIMVVHAGNGQESSGISDDIWSVRWSWSGHFATDEKTFDSCSIVPEFQGGDVDRSIGVIAHEFGHDIGLPDLYHYGKTGSDDLVGIWDLMASGSWGGSPSGTVPVHMSSYSKLMLDWYDDTEIYDLTSGTYEATLTSSYNQTSGLRVIRYNITDTYYYLVEARYQAGYDASLYESGVLITRVDTTLGSGDGIVQVRSDSISDLSLGAWIPGQEFVDEVASFAVEVLSQEGTSFRVRVTTNPIDGWLDESTLSGTSHLDYQTPVMATNSIGTIYCVYSVWNSSISQYSIQARYSDDGGYSWSDAFSFFNTSYSYINPSLAIDPYDDSLYIAYESTDGATHDARLVRFSSDHNLITSTTVSVNSQDPSIATDYVYGATNYLMIAYEAWTGGSSSVIEVAVSTDQGTTWILRDSLSIDTYNIQPEIVGSYGFDGVNRWHVVFVGGNSISNITKIVAARSSDYFDTMNGWTTTFSVTISNPTITAIRGSPEVFFAWTVNSYEVNAAFQHDLYIWYSADHAESISANTLLMSTTDDEKYPTLAADNQGSVRYEKGVVILSYYNGDDVCIRRMYYDRPDLLGDEEILCSTGYDISGGIAVASHYISSSVGRFYPVVAWMNDTTSHDIVYAVPGYYKEFGASSPGYTITVNGQDYTCPITIGLMFGYDYDIEVGSYHYTSSTERMRFDSWQITPGGEYTGYQNFTIASNRFDTGYDLLSITQYYLTVTSTYGTTGGAGWYDSGTTAHASLNTNIVPGAAGVQYVFTSWGGDASGFDYSSSNGILMDGAKTATAGWKTQYFLTVNSDHGSTGGEGWYDSGSSAYASVNAGIITGGTGIQYVFTSWTGDASGSDHSSSDSITMNSPKSATADWKTQYYLTVSSDHGTIGGDGWYDAGTLASASIDTDLIAGDTGVQYEFIEWIGDATGLDYAASDSITMDGPKTATARWETQYYLMIQSDYGSVSGDGWYAAGATAHAMLDTDIIDVQTGERIAFQNWKDDATGTDYSTSDDISMDGPKMATAVWETEFFFTIETEHSTSSSQGWYIENSTVYAGLDSGIVTGDTGTRYRFDEWSGDASGSDYAESEGIFLDRPKTAQAIWITQFNLICDTNPNDITPQPTITPSGNWFNINTNVTVTAESVEGYQFSYWLLDAVQLEIGVDSIEVTMNEPHIAIAFYDSITTSTTTTTTTEPTETSGTTDTSTPTISDNPLSGMLMLAVGVAGIGIVVILIAVMIKRKAT